MSTCKDGLAQCRVVLCGAAGGREVLRCSLTSLVSSQAADEMRVSCGLAAPPGPLLVDGPKGLPGREGLAPNPSLGTTGECLGNGWELTKQRDVRGMWARGFCSSSHGEIFSVQRESRMALACVGVSVCARGGMDATQPVDCRVAAQAVACMRVLRLQLASARAAVRARDWSPRVAGRSVILRALPHTAYSGRKMRVGPPVKV